MTIITHDVKSQLTQGERDYVNAGKLHNIDLTELFYADDTLIMASTSEAAETILQHIEKESGRYNMKLNFDKCIHLRMNAISRIRYANGDYMPMEPHAMYLGGKISANGDYKGEIKNRIAQTWPVVRKLDLLWKKHQSRLSGNFEFSTRLSSQNYSTDLSPSPSRNRTALN